jgi:glycosyltransferase involved in cell wall biosynthesis
MWQNLTVAVILPTYNEADSIAACVAKFAALGLVDDIIVVNNNAHPDTSPNLVGTAAREVFEARQGYGSAIRRGFSETTADIVCVCEPDGTFDPNDLFKLLPFLTDSDVVLGSRTVNQFIFDGANMDLSLKWGNWAVAKMVEVLFNTAYLSDVGCTFRILKRPVIEDITPFFDLYGSSFGLEMMLLTVIRRHGFVQVPVRYLPRIGESSVTGNRGKAIVLGFEMIGLVLRMRLRSYGKRPAKKPIR